MTFKQILFSLIATLLLIGCSTQTDVDNGKLNVVTTVSPITNIVYNIGGNHINITGIVPEGVNSHTFEPVPSDAVKLANADLIFLNGLKLEQPTLALAEANVKDGGEIVLLGDLTIDPADYVYDFSFPENAGSPNPHLWTNPILALEYAGIIHQKLATADPTNADSYQANYNTFAQRITALDQAITATTNSIPPENRKLLTYHDSFAYFAPRYGYTIIGAIQPADFSEPSAQEMAGLIEQLRAEKVPAIFGSEVFPSPILDQIGKEANVQFIATLRDDDLPGNPGDNNHSYIGLMVADLQIMAQALGGNPTLMDTVDTTNIPGPDTNIQQK